MQLFKLCNNNVFPEIIWPQLILIQSLRPYSVLYFLLKMPECTENSAVTKRRKSLKRFLKVIDTLKGNVSTWYYKREIICA